MRRCWTQKLDLEVAFYFAVYISYLIYGFKAVFELRDEILAIAVHQFDEGFSFLKRARDPANYELEHFTKSLLQWWHWYVLHLIMTAISRIWLPPARQSSCHALVCSLILICLFKPISVCILASLLITFLFAKHYEASKLITWLLAGLWMVLINALKYSKLIDLVDYEEFYTLSVAMSWIVLRCCSFMLSRNCDKIAGATNIQQLYTIEHFLGYTLYFPCMVFGPFLSFRRYSAMLSTAQSRHLKDLWPKCFSLLQTLLRMLFWWFVLQVAHHFLYISYMSREVSTLKLLPSPYTHYAVGYFIGLFFFIYYLVSYGLGIAIAKFDGLDPPAPPRCIGCVHFYSDMWKYFDVGLYEFLFRHIYAEICDRKSRIYLKVFAMASTFSFVFIWHGFFAYVFVWSALNFACLVAEKLFKRFIFSEFYKETITRRIGVDNALRLRALLGTQLFIPAAFSNVYFIGGPKIGEFLIYSTYTNGIVNYLTLTFCSYCFYQCCETITKLRNSKSTNICNKIAR